MKVIQAVLVIMLQLGVFLEACSDGNKKDYLITIKTPFGEMKAILYDATPVHKQNFIKLAKEGYYDSLLFHRVIKGFMIQTGDPESRKALQGQKLGNGGPGYTLPAEFNPNFIHEKGAIAAARLGDNVNPKKESSGSQFYIVEGKVFSKEELQASRIDYTLLNKYLTIYLQRPENKGLLNQVLELEKGNKLDSLQKLIFSQKDIIAKTYNINPDLPLSNLQIQKYTSVGGAPHLDGNYTVFGKVISGLDVIDKIAAVETDANNRPVKDVAMTVTVEEMPRKKISRLYGYVYPENQ